MKKLYFLFVLALAACGPAPVVKSKTVCGVSDPAQQLILTHVTIQYVDGTRDVFCEVAGPRQSISGSRTWLPDGGQNYNDSWCGLIGDVDATPSFGTWVFTHHDQEVSAFAAYADPGSPFDGFRETLNCAVQKWEDLKH